MPLMSHHSGQVTVGPTKCSGCPPDYKPLTNRWNELKTENKNTKALNIAFYWYSEFLLIYYRYTGRDFAIDTFSVP